MGIFSWIGKLFLGQAKDAAAAIIHDEIHKVHDEIADSIAPYLTQIPAEGRQQVLENITEVAKKAAVAYAEAYINAHLPPIPSIQPPSVPDTAPPA